MKLILGVLCISTVLLTMGTILLGGNKAPRSNSTPASPASADIKRPSPKGMFVTKWDAISPGYHEVSGLFFDGISDRNELSSEPRYGPTFSFTVEGVAYANLEPIGIMPVQHTSDPKRPFQVEILVQRKKDGHNGFILRVPETTAWLNEIQQATPQYILSGR